MPLLAVVLTSLLATANGAPPSAPTKAPAQSDSVACKGEQQPQAKADDAEPPQTPEQKAAAAAYQDYMRALVQSLSKSPSPRDRALALQMGFFADVWDSHQSTPAEKAQRGTVLRAAAEAAPDDVLVQWLWVRANPEESGCNAAKPCVHRLEAVARMQPDNGSAWVPLFNAKWKAKDIPAAETVLATMARASYFDEQQGTAVKAWMEMFHRYPIPESAFVPGSPEANLDQQTIEFSNSISLAAAIAMPFLGDTVDACRRERHPDASPQRFRDCAQVGRSMLAHATSLIDRQIGRALLRVSGQATAVDIANARVQDWQYEQWENLLPGLSENDLGYLKENAADWMDTGDEIKVLQHQMQRKGIPLTPPADWQPRGRDGKPISPLGEDPAPAHQP